MNLASTRRNWPTGRGFERFYGFLGAETNQWYPDLVYDNHPVDQPAARRRLPPHRRPHRQGDRVHRRREGDRAGQAVLPVLRAGRRHAPHHAPKEWIEKFTGQFDMGYEAIREETLARQKELGIVPENTELPPVNPIGTPETRTGPGRQAVPAAGLHQAVGLADRGREAAVRPDGRGLRRVPRPRRPPHRPAARLPGGDRPARQHARHRRLRQRRDSGEGGPDGSVNENKFFNGIPDDLAGEPGDARRAGQPEDLQPLPDRLGDGLQHPVQDVEALRVQRRHRRPVHHLLAVGHGPRRRAPRPVPPRHRHRAHRAGPARRGAAGGDQGVHPVPLRRGQHALQLRRPAAPSRGRRSSTRCSARGRSGTTAGRRSPPTRRISGWSHFNDDTWELYHTEVDRSELHDLAAEEPDRLRELVNLWFHEAGANGRSRSTTVRARDPHDPRPQLAPRATATSTVPAAPRSPRRRR